MLNILIHGVGRKLAFSVPSQFSQFSPEPVYPLSVQRDITEVRKCALGKRPKWMPGGNKSRAMSHVPTEGSFWDGEVQTRALHQITVLHNSSNMANSKLPNSSSEYCILHNAQNGQGTISDCFFAAKYKTEFSAMNRTEEFPASRLVPKAAWVLQAHQGHPQRNFLYLQLTIL